MPIGETLRALGNNDGTGLCKHLQARSEVWRFADDRLLLGRTFTDQIADNHGASGNADTHLEFLADVGREGRDSVHQCEACARCLLGIIFVCDGIAEGSKDAIAEILDDNAVVPADDLCDTVVIGPDNGLRSSGSSRTDSADEPTRSQNIKVS